MTVFRTDDGDHCCAMSLARVALRLRSASNRASMVDYKRYDSTHPALGGRRPTDARLVWREQLRVLALLSSPRTSSSLSSKSTDSDIYRPPSPRRRPHCRDIIENRNDSWRFEAVKRSRIHQLSTRSDATSAVAKYRID
jgi:hypothetical protein